MKNWLNKSLVFVLASLTLMSCEKDEDKLILREGTPPMLSASSTNVVLTEETAEGTALTLNWNEADFGFDAATEYSLQIDTAGDNFVAPYSVSLGNKMTSKAYTGQELNTLMSRLKYTPEEMHEVKFRIRAGVSEFVNPVYSNVVTVNVTPYNTYIEPTFIYVPGDYQGWNPGTAPSLISVEANNIYQGIISFTDPGKSRMFKFTAERSWDLNWGNGATAGTLAENGSDLSVPANDSYMLIVNLNTLTWSATKHSWGVIGSATAGGWDSDQNMRYINEEDVWKATLDLKVGDIKFRFNDAWDINYGGKDGNLNLGGDNIAITAAGKYEITLKIDEEAETATYTLVKL
ncbi:SusE domain-containing protein [Pontibacter indicus]|uniref:SusE outer membrane protein n=1 Tax=Pontibacter indicus TaxID=1317125 RepID=A0A1R3X145_9BACT|nr:SusE domain-containing protein [Pontibacter indicus]SIT84554.1 SusE outer membrane protein [Pontibacter indicus]